MSTLNLPQYQCHKVVGAAKIADIARDSTEPVGSDRAYRITFTNPNLPPVHVPAWFFAKHQPQVGGYLVQYEDGYLSWSPGDVFEAGYSKVIPKPAHPNAVTVISEEHQRLIDLAEKERLTRTAPEEQARIAGIE